MDTLERPAGLAPASPTWEAGALLLCYGRIRSLSVQSPRAGIEWGSGLALPGPNPIPLWIALFRQPDCQGGRRLHHADRCYSWALVRRFKGPTKNPAFLRARGFLFSSGSGATSSPRARTPTRPLDSPASYLRGPRGGRCTTAGARTYLDWRRRIGCTLSLLGGMISTWSRNAHLR